MNRSIKILAAAFLSLGLAACATERLTSESASSTGQSVVEQPLLPVKTEPETLRPPVTGNGGKVITNVIVDKLPRQPPPGLVTTYSFRFENFRMPEVLTIKGVMERDFSGFVRAGKLTGSEPIVQYGYVSTAPQGKVMEWVYILLREMRINDAKVISQGNGFTIKRLGSDLPPPPPTPAASGGRFR